MTLPVRSDLFGLGAQTQHKGGTARRIESHQTPIVTERGGAAEGQILPASYLKNTPGFAWLLFGGCMMRHFFAERTRKL